MSKEEYPEEARKSDRCRRRKKEMRRRRVRGRGRWSRRYECTGVGHDSGRLFSEVDGSGWEESSVLLLIFIIPEKEL